MKTAWSVCQLVGQLAIILVTIQETIGQGIRKSIAEETASDKYILNVPQELKIVNLPQKEFKVITGNKYVTINPTSGDLRTRNKMDREALCPDNRPECTVDVEILLMAPKFPPEMIKIQLVVTDINDNAPKFENSLIEKQISELTAVGTVIRLDSAVDPDLGANSIAGYSIEIPKGSRTPGRNDNYFRLTEIKNADGTIIPQLTLRKKFDREELSVHELQLVARDGGKPQRRGVALVRINVTDSNDNKPKFDQEKYDVLVAEDAQPDTVVTKVTATDLDKGINGMVRYSFPSVVSSSDRELFALDTETGVITLKKLLDYESKQMHHLTIEARDLGPNPTSAYATVTVKVLDVNDNKPEVNVKFLSEEGVEESEGSITSQIPEDFLVGDYLAFVTITDKDKGVNGTVACKMASAKFELTVVEKNENRYLLKTTAPLDREIHNSYDLIIEAWDMGTPPLRSTKHVIIKLKDVNDNAPTFDHDEFIAGVKESATAKTIFQTLQAADRDEGENSRITYTFKDTKDSITTSDGEIYPLTDIFAIDENSGEISLIKEGVLDAETNENPGTITVVAMDNGEPRLNTTTSLVISVIDDNDNSPHFEDDIDEYVFRIPEHSKYGSFVGRVKATDDDVTKSSNALVKYSLKQRTVEGVKGDDKWISFFVINEMSGEIHFYGNESKLDRESDHVSPSTFVVVATDSGRPPLSDEKVLKIYLTDINDNAPIVSSPNVSRDVAFVRIPDMTSTDYYPEEVMYDDDYMPTSYRQLNRKSKFASSVVIERPISVEDENDESYPVLTRVIATDPDEGENSHVSFAIADGNNRNYFQIDHRSGNITFARDVDFSNMKHGCHVIKILVRDLGEVTQKTDAWVNIYISTASEDDSNATEAMLDCKASPLYPVDLGKDPKVKAGALGEFTMYIIIGLAALVIIIIIVIILVVIFARCNCCGGKGEKKYPIGGGGGIYSADRRKKAKQNLYEPNPRQIGDQEGRSHPNGTVDSRSSFYSEWTQSQNQMHQQEKQDHVGNLPVQSNRNSVASHNSGRDSGTGDSMPSDAYHGIHQSHRPQEYGEEMYPQYRGYPPQNYHHPQEYQQRPDDEHMAPLVVNLPPPEGVFSTKCTEDCRMYGHSDTCWMPDSLQRPVSRVTTFTGQDYDSSSLKHRRPGFEPTDPSDMRYTPQQPYYYDPVNKFNNEYPPYNGTTGRGGFSSFQEDPNEAKRHSQAPSQPRGSFAASNHPSFRSTQGGPRLPQSHVDEVNSNLSSTSSNNAGPYNAGYPRNQQFYPPHINYSGYPEVPVSVPYNPNQQQYYDPNGYNQQGFQPPYDPNEGYEEDYSAANLMSPTDADARYFLPSDNPLPGPHSNYPEYMQYPDGIEDTQKLVEAKESPHASNGEEDPDEKLTTIREDIDAEEVVNEINTLLLDDPPAKKSMDPRFYGNEV